KGTLTIPVPGLPVDATAVAINLTGTGVSATTFLSVFAGGTAWSGSSNLNLGRGQTAAVFAVSQLGAGGTVTIRNDAGTTYPIVDVVGYFGTAAETGKYAPLPANRVLDTRSGPGAGQLVAGQTIHVNPGAAAAGASAVVVNVTATRGQHPGVLSLSPDCSKTSSTLNYTTDTRANMAIVKPDGTGSICIAGSGGPVDVVLDVIGYFSPTASAEFVALPVPVRIADTRTGNAGRLGALGAAGEMSLYAAGIFDVPYGATALLTNVTGTAATRSTYLEVFPGTLRPSPDTSTLNLSAGQTVPNAAVANVSGHVFSVLNNAGTTQTIVDLFGYFI
ncbi:MAG: hypothetical protein JWO57_179, partial [Pseudonocardiales bacterium]|nr:hypothetical protein [Pseudonocardiales bacterium]